MGAARAPMAVLPLIRHGSSLAAAGALTWWFLFHVPAPEVLRPPSPAKAPSLQIAQAADGGLSAPAVAPPDVAAPEPDAPEPAPSTEQPEDGAAPPEEAGSREGQEDGELQEPLEEGKDPAGEAPGPEEPAEVAAEDASQDPVDTLKELTEDRELLQAARRELDGDVKLGFSTQFLCAAEDQLAIARAFGEQVVLIPRSALDDEDANASSYVLDLGPGARVKKVPGRPDLSRFRQYRDLFGFEYSSLPEPMRKLRTAVVRRDQVFLFAALIPANEWAVAVGRRRQVLEQIGRTEGDVERFTLRYVPASGGRFDFSVEAIEFADGSKWRAGGVPRR